MAAAMAEAFFVHAEEIAGFLEVRGCRLRCVSGAALIERCLFCVIRAACCFFVGDGGVVAFRRGGIAML